MSGGQIQACGGPLNPWNYEATPLRKGIVSVAVGLAAIGVAAGFFAILTASGVDLHAFNALSALTIEGGVALSLFSLAFVTLGIAWLATKSCHRNAPEPRERKLRPDPQRNNSNRSPQSQVQFTPTHSVGTDASSSTPEPRERKLRPDPQRNNSNRSPQSQVQFTPMHTVETDDASSSNKESEVNEITEPTSLYKAEEGSLMMKDLLQYLEHGDYSNFKFDMEMWMNTLFFAAQQDAPWAIEICFDICTHAGIENMSYKHLLCPYKEELKSYARKDGRFQSIKRSPVFPTGELLDATITLKSILSDDEIKIVILGESHSDPNVNTFLSMYINEFAENGYEVLISEFFCQTSQKRYDEWHFNPGEDEAIPRAIYRPSKIISHFNQVGIRLVGLESAYSNQRMACNGIDSDRKEQLDSQIPGVVREQIDDKKELSKNKKGKRKIIVWCGAAHVEGIVRYLVQDTKYTRDKICTLGVEPEQHMQLHSVIPDEIKTDNKMHKTTIPWNIYRPSTNQKEWKIIKEAYVSKYHMDYVLYIPSV